MNSENGTGPSDVLNTGTVCRLETLKWCQGNINKETTESTYMVPTDGHREFLDTKASAD